MKSAPRPYDNALRTEQAAATRERIVDATIAVLARGPDELSIPAVSAAAAVSVPTVYRHFSSKKALVDAVYDRYADEIDVRWTGDPPRNLEDYLVRIPGVFARQAEVPAPLRAVMSGPAGLRARRDHMPERLDRVEAVIEHVGLADDDHARLRDLLVVLSSSAVQQAFRDYLGVGPEVAADRVTWAIRRLATPKTTRKTKRGK